MKKSIFYVLLVALGVLSGWIIFGEKSQKNHNHIESAKETIYTCSMHPQIRLTDPKSKCPLCGMDLIPVATEDENSTQGDDSFTMSAAAVALSNVEILKAKKGEPQKMLRLYGSIQANELKKHSQTVHIGGRIEKLFVNFEGEQVRKGQILASIYSPELLVAQTEFLEALKQKYPVIIEATKERLRLLKVTESQILDLEGTGKANPYVNVFADANGIVIAKKTERGEYVEAGTVLFDLADLSSVWAVFSAHEPDLAYLKMNDLIGYTVNSLPGTVFTGRIEFISPVVDSMSRTAKVRMETANKNLKLKPGMLATAIIHNAKISEETIILPKTAVLWTGERSIVYVAKKLENSALNFSLREVLLGHTLGDSVAIISGIYEGELVVASGTFAVDASAQLAGKKSMMNLHQQGDTMNTIAKLAVAVICSTAFACNEEHKAHQPPVAQEKAVAAQTQNASVQKISLAVQGACEMCKMKIESTAKAIEGVKTAEWNLTTKILNAEFDPGKTSQSAISKAIAAVGYDTEIDRASDIVYNSLPGCCKYRK
ncbi:MAG: efflux RND transporter periplasmic adaptor subunit [Fibromonadales bacterium]|nr:efflux RND transporter periplasmic adaptor subunit [Fibromonadales bacterium]